MNTEKSQSPQIGNAILDNRFTILLSTIAGVAMIIIVIFVLEVLKRGSKLQLAEHRLATSAETYENAKGLPATVGNLREGTIYFVSAVMSNQRPDETEHFAVLHKVIVVNVDEYRHSREERFFRLPFPLEPHKYFQFFRSASGKIARAEEYPPPTPPKLELRYK